MDFSIPVSKIFISDKNDNNIGEWSKTLKNKDVNVKISREEVKIKRPYTYVEKKILTKQIVKAEFSIICVFDVFKQLFKYDQETCLIENMRVGFVMGSRFESLELYNCNISIEADINFKVDKESMVKFKIEAQGVDGKYFDLRKGRTYEQIKDQGLTYQDLRKYTYWEIKYLNKLDR